VHFIIRLGKVLSRHAVSLSRTFTPPRLMKKAQRISAESSTINNFSDMPASSPFLPRLHHQALLIFLSDTDDAG
jgi:hypothetical protein